MNPLQAVKEAQHLADYNQEPYVVISQKGAIMVCADRVEIVPHGAVVLERCWP